MAISRREFLYWCGAAMAAGAAPIGAQAALSAADTPAPPPTELTGLTAAFFARHLGETFHAREALREKDIPLTLVKVVEPPERLTKDTRGRVRMRTFSAVFDGSLETRVASDMVTLSHPAMGGHLLLMTPIVSRDASKMQYQVVFNHLLK